jgi:glycosyltransferase involved in cell wall biosynthesis
MQNKGLHIAIIASWYPSDNQPFYGIFVEEQALLLKRSGHRVVVFYPYLNGDFKTFIKGNKKKVEIRKRNGVDIVEVPQNIYLPKAKEVFISLLIKKSLKCFKKYIERESTPDIIHSHSAFMGGIIGLNLKKHFKIPLVHTEHSSGFIFQKEQYTKLDVEKVTLLYNQSNKFLFVSNYFKTSFETLLNLKGHQSCVLPNLVADDFFDNPHPLPTSSIKALSVGSLIQVKNHLLLLKAWTNVVKKYPDAQLVIAGNGVLENELKEFAIQESIHETIHWQNGVTKDELIRLIDGSNIVVSTSFRETFGLILAESLARGRPVVSTNSGGPRDFVNETNGMLVPYQPEEVSNAIILIFEKIASYEPLILSANCRDKFGSKIIIDHLIKIYEEAIKNK